MTNSNLNTGIIKNRYALFIGAGASAPLGLKPTVPFLKLLTGKLLPLVAQGENMSSFSEESFTDLLNGLFKKATQHFGVTLPDSEVVLDYLDYLVSACLELDSLPTEFKNLAQTGGVGGFHRRWAEMLSRLRSYIQKVVVEHYSTVDGKHASKIYKPLLSSLCEQGQMLPIFTTNYDWAFEHLADIKPRSIYLKDGFKNSPLGERWARDVFDKFSPRQTKTNLVLFKLHGSTSWYRDAVSPELIRKFSTPTPELAGSRAALIYPTQVKTQAIQEEPFQTAYEYLRETMLHTKLIVIIGFSFRDPAINDALHHALTKNKHLKLAVIEPNMDESPGVAFKELLDKLGIREQEWKKRIRVIKGRFGDEPFVYEEVEKTVQSLDQWDSLKPWCERTNT